MASTWLLTLMYVASSVLDYTSTNDQFAKRKIAKNSISVIVILDYWVICNPSQASLSHSTVSLAHLITSRINMRKYRLIIASNNSEMARRDDITREITRA